MEKKKINITITKEPYEELQNIVKLMGWPKNWLSFEIDKTVKGLLIVAKQAMKDAEEKREMTDEEAKKRYETLMRKILESN